MGWKHFGAVLDFSLMGWMGRALHRSLGSVCVCMCVGTYMYAFVSNLYKMADGIGTVFYLETWVTPLFSVYWEIS